MSESTNAYAIALCRLTHPGVDAGTKKEMEDFLWAELVALADAVAALTAENERQAKAISFAVGWLGAMLERRQYEDDHELREMQDMLAAAQLVEVKEHG